MASDKEIAMAFNLKNRHLLSLVHHSEREINYLLDLRESSYLPYNSNSESAHVLNLLGLVEL